MRVEVVAIGTELLLGQITDTNSAWIGEQLALVGLDSHYQTKVGDNLDRIVATLRIALDRSDAIICCGGLGPTQDDLTRDAIAAVMGTRLEPDEEMEERIIGLFASAGRRMPANNLRQAEKPIGANFIAEMPGTAPGLVCLMRWPAGSGNFVGGAGPTGAGAEASGAEGTGTAGAGAEGATAEGMGPGGGGTVEKVIYAVPGVPWEMKEMILGTVLVDLERRAGIEAVIRSRTLRTWGESESALAEMLAERIYELDKAGNPTIAFLASGMEGLKVRITAKCASGEEADRLLAEEEVRLRDLLGPLVFGADDETMESAVLGLLRSRGLTLAVAESLTGGMVGSRLCDVPGASEVFRGGVVSYSPEVKHAVLGVPEGPVVTESAALAMAEGVQALMGADVAIAATGVAGPSAQEDRPVGTVCLAVVVGDLAAGGMRDSIEVRLPGRRQQIREFTVISLLGLLRRRLLEWDL